MRNIDMFNLSVAEITGLCYENFPHRIEITTHNIAEKLTNYYEIDEDNTEEVADFIHESTEMVESTAYWLEQAGYIWVEAQADGSFYNVTLTPKTLEIMNMVPNSLQESIGSKLVSTASEISKQGAISTAVTMLAAGAKLAVGAAI
jgi:selenophosphate synthetase-related protein